MFRRRVPFTQMAFATLLGVAGGIYIYRPYFDPVPKNSGQQNEGMTKKQNETDNNSSLSGNTSQTEARITK
ncbi:protein PIGBOS1 [Seriola dumerili]|uniref:protein PIGBOS1 n=1 Tax=Seriola dumerili TaxID=41447 RepID=UPI000BBEDA46|nr:protein PIGBOS1 [Seriola dumerili]